ncbi:RdgB/HAM1 family non-canonical purine NTP pyrophosphatase [Denitrobaculum tricleocarpae]|uniref:dITP/XTP pyrophosphatase n=1 Tax=Denitrobaculum tricleocarpae TaxID=2591009 RepID=A0A545TRN3_9PROT|nr:RdgB/HAM1 family non-canonical purine NTP pyrophosphatase [Denitrobaculum tricleocarpae]TQV79869.1 RdgB/HAM1 family non-canonical purine NTP pyrophosphatase [Denitrobaculum tricleocarpae]
MKPNLTQEKLVLASHNAGKLREIADLLRPYGVRVTSAGELGLLEPEETETTFTGNAILKARASAEASGLPALADDSGLAVDALDGQPGIYSARWAETDGSGAAGGKRDFGFAMERVQRELDGQSDRSARFVCALCLYWPNGDKLVYEGEVRGTMVWPPRGTRGFGYDPMFQPDGYETTFGEMDPDAKHAISHRADAFRKLVADVFDEK